MSANAKVIRSCILRSRNYKYRDVFLPDKTPTIVGRGLQTKIRERRCSKAQIQITADYSEQKASILQLGPNPSEIENKLVAAQEHIEVPNGASVNLIKDDLKYTVEFLDEDHDHSTRHRHHPRHSSHNSNKKLKVDEAPNASLVESASSASGDGSADCQPDESAAKSIAEDESSDDELQRQKEIEAKLEGLRKTVVDDFQALSTTDTWEEYDHSKILIFTPAYMKGAEKVAAFDLDHTIITTKTGKVFPTDTNDWRIMFPETPGKLKKLASDGYKIVFFTNQKGISRGKTSAPDFKKKVERIIQRLGIPIQALVSTGHGKYRKPNTGMWDYFVQKCNQNVPVDLDSCVYVGDAAGRPEKWAPKKKKDFSCADRLFALNVGIKFFTPEEFFLGEKPAPYKMPIFDPRNIGNVPLAVKCEPLPKTELSSESIAASQSEVVVFVGFPAAGKSHFASFYLIPNGYVHINRDSLGSWQKCVSECTKALSKGLKVVIDNTNPDVESRARYIDCSKKFRVPCRCFHFVCSLEQARHNNIYRELSNPDEKHVGVNDMVLNGYKSKFKEPTLREGFTEIVNVNFVPKFKNKHEEKLFKRFLLEK
ncbi:uncharacterized protein F21D5.5-like [Uloborus diversus]|uniref:uncharacterized protein F21D5.5-like n=1 Tax=Uloborus diversus TaxID=327109 RepID=UPI002409CBFA|nr:uncharacterized protein F21D5.5-like [Uloborus diversus]